MAGVGQAFYMKVDELPAETVHCTYGVFHAHQKIIALVGIQYFIMFGWRGLDDAGRTCRAIVQ